MADRYILFRNSMHHGEVVYRAGGVVTTGDGWRQKPTYASYSRVDYVRAGSGMLYSEQEQMPLERQFRFSLVLPSLMMVVSFL